MKDFIEKRIKNINEQLEILLFEYNAMSQKRRFDWLKIEDCKHQIIRLTILRKELTKIKKEIEELRGDKNDK